MVHRCKKYSDISEVTSGGRAEIENVKNDRPSDLHFNLRQQMLLVTAFNTSMERWAKSPLFGFGKWFISQITGQNADFCYFCFINIRYCLSEIKYYTVT